MNDNAIPAGHTRAIFTWSATVCPYNATVTLAGAGGSASVTQNRYRFEGAGQGTIPLPTPGPGGFRIFTVNASPEPYCSITHTANPPRLELRVVTQ